MSEFARKCLAAIASVAMTGTIVFALVLLAEAYGVFNWMDAADSLAAVSSMPHHIALNPMPAGATGTTHF